jgi:cold shock protein
VASGFVKWFNQVSGYGFIASDEAGPDRYVRRENIIGAPSTLVVDVRVRFEPREAGMGPEAINVRLLS